MTTETFVVNTTTFGLSEYTGGFANANAVCDLDGQLYCITDTDLYEQTGDDDDGTDIDCSITTGLLSFGTQRQKRISLVIASSDSSNEVAVDIATSTDNTMDNATYYPCDSKRTHGTPTVSKNTEFDPPRSVRSEALGVRVSNVDGADFDLISLRAVAAPTRLR